MAKIKAKRTADQQNQGGMNHGDKMVTVPKELSTDYQRIVEFIVKQGW